MYLLHYILGCIPVCKPRPCLLHALLVLFVPKNVVWIKGEKELSNTRLITAKSEGKISLGALFQLKGRAL